MTLMKKLLIKWVFRTPTLRDLEDSTLTAKWKQSGIAGCVQFTSTVRSWRDRVCCAMRRRVQEHVAQRPMTLTR